MNIINEHVIIGILITFILYKYYNENNVEIMNMHENINLNIPKNNLEIPNYNKNMLNIFNKSKGKSCKIPNKKVAECVTNKLIDTGCVKCSLESCDTNKTISASCYENEKHNCQKSNNLHDSIYNSVKTNINSNIDSNILGNSINDGYDTCNLEESNSFTNLNQGNASGILYKGHNNNNHYGLLNTSFQIENYNNRLINDYAQNTVPRDVGLQRSLDGSFFKYSRFE